MTGFLLAVVFTFLWLSASSDNSEVDQLVMRVCALVAAVLTARSVLLGSWLDSNRLIIRTWLRTISVPLDEVLRFDSVHKRDRTFPAVVLSSGRQIPMPGLERGLMFELRAADDQWGSVLQELNESLAARRNGKWA